MLSNTSDSNRGKSLLFWLTVIMIIRITSYFMLSESVIITQAFKIGLRFFVSAVSFIMLRQLFVRDKSISFSFTYPLPLLLYVAYLVLGMFSMLWTTGMADTLLQLLMDVECFIFCIFYFHSLAVHNRLYQKQIRLSSILGITVFLIMLAFLAGMYLDPDKFYRLTHGGEVARLGGFIINPNELGMLIVTGFAMCCVELKFTNNKPAWLFVMAVLIYTLVLTGSRSSMIGLFLIVLFYLKKSGNIRLQLSVVVLMLLSIPFVINEIFIKAGDTSEVMNMTGRIPFWQDLLTINFPKAPILGYGFMRIDTHDRFESLHSYAGEMTHNTFIQVLMNLGLVGLFIVLLQLACMIQAMVSDKDKDKKLIAVGIFIPVLINSFTEFGIFGETNYGIMLYLFLVLMYSTGVNKAGFSSYAGRHGLAEKNTILRPSFTS